MTFVLDTNTISYLMRNEGNARQNYAKHILQGENSYAIPLIIIYETKRWLLYKPNKELKNFLKKFEILLDGAEDNAEMSSAVWEKAVDIYITLQSKGQLVGDADILIAAYCIVNDYTLVTRNAKDFARIDELKFVDWF